MVKRKKSVEKVSKKSHENKVLLGLGILIGLFLLFGFSLQTQNITGYATAPSTNLASPTEALKSLGTGIISLLEPLASTLLGDVKVNGTASGDMLFAKVLFLIIIFGVFYVSLNSLGFFSEHKGILFLIIASASILSVRWLGDISWIKAIILPYSAVGITITAGLPFVLYFLVVNKGLAQQPSIIRRTAWIFFGVIFIGLYYSRMGDIGYVINLYPVIAVCAIIMAWADGTIQKLFIKIHAGRVSIEINEKILRSLRTELADLGQQLQTGAVTTSDYQKNAKKIQDKILALSKN